MSKAVTGAFEIAAGALMIVGAAVFDPALFANPQFDELAAGLIIGGISSILSANPALNQTVRQPAQYRRIIYGMQRVGGAEIYVSSTGSSAGQYNNVLVLATHECAGIVGTYLDGREVYWQGSGNGWTVSPGGIGFGGVPDGNDHTGPDGRIYNFSSTDFFAEARYGTQLAGDIIGALTANDGTWTGTVNGTPYVGGCTYLYSKVEYNPTNFVQFPDMKFTVMGKPIYDPRTGVTAYSTNPALIINDILSDPDSGLADLTVNVEWLIAAANICDEQVYIEATGAYEARYSASYNYDSSTGVGDAVTTILATMGGRMSRIGGEWYIFPAAFYGATLSFDADDLIGTPSWSSTRKYRELFNQVNGTYVAPNYPYNVLQDGGDLYDSNGFYNGQIQNNFAFGFKQTNFPPYACDTLHGYAANQYLIEDGNQVLTKELGLPACLSLTQAQRLAKIELLRNRWQGTGAMTMKLSALQLQPCDTFDMRFAQNGWAGKLLEVNGFQTKVTKTSDGKPQIVCLVSVNETDPEIYEWNPATDEQTIYDQPPVPQQLSYVPDPPTNMTVTSLVTAQPDAAWCMRCRSHGTLRSIRVCRRSRCSIRLRRRAHGSMAARCRCCRTRRCCGTSSPG